MRSSSRNQRAGILTLPDQRNGYCYCCRNHPNFPETRSGASCLTDMWGFLFWLCCLVAVSASPFINQWTHINLPCKTWIPPLSTEIQWWAFWAELTAVLDAIWLPTRDGCLTLCLGLCRDGRVLILEGGTVQNGAKGIKTKLALRRK